MLPPKNVDRSRKNLSYVIYQNFCSKSPITDITTAEIESYYDDEELNKRSKIVQLAFLDRQESSYKIRDTLPKAKRSSLPPYYQWMLFPSRSEFNRKAALITVHAFAALLSEFKEILTPLPFPGLESRPILFNREGKLQLVVISAFLASGYKLVGLEWSCSKCKGIGDLVFCRNDTFVVVETKMKSGALTQALRYTSSFKDFLQSQDPFLMSKEKQVYGASMSPGSGVVFYMGKKPLDKNKTISIMAEINLIVSDALGSFVGDTLHRAELVPHLGICEALAGSCDDLHTCDFDVISDSSNGVKPAKVAPPATKKVIDTKVEPSKPVSSSPVSNHPFSNTLVATRQLNNFSDVF